MHRWAFRAKWPAWSKSRSSTADRGCVQPEPHAPSRFRSRSLNFPLTWRGVSGPYSQLRFVQRCPATADAPFSAANWAAVFATIRTVQKSSARLVSVR